MPGYHGEGSPFIDSFNANAKPLLDRIEKLEAQVKKLKKAKKGAATSPAGGR